MLKLYTCLKRALYKAHNVKNLIFLYPKKGNHKETPNIFQKFGKQKLELKGTRGPVLSNSCVQLISI